MALACERCHAPLLNVAQSLFAFNDVRVRFVNARRREFALVQESLDNRNRFRRKVRIVLELIRHCEYVHARLKRKQHHLLVAIVLRDRPHLHVVGNHNAVLVQLLAQNASDDRL
jgi:hypothetical protein